MTSDKAELVVVENFLEENNINGRHPLEIVEWRSSPCSLSSENKQVLLVLDREIVTWARKDWMMFLNYWLVFSFSLARRMGLSSVVGLGTCLRDGGDLEKFYY